MEHRTQFYIGGEWVDPIDDQRLDVINPATEQVIGEVAMGGLEDVDRAVAAAVAAFDSFSQTSREERLELLSRIVDAYKNRILRRGQGDQRGDGRTDGDSPWRPRRRLASATSCPP